jgi:hypothetical protein
MDWLVWGKSGGRKPSIFPFRSLIGLQRRRASCGRSSDACAGENGAESAMCCRHRIGGDKVDDMLRLLIQTYHIITICWGDDPRLPVILAFTRIPEFRPISNHNHTRWLKPTCPFGKPGHERLHVSRSGDLPIAVKHGKTSIYSAFSGIFHMFSWFSRWNLNNVGFCLCWRLGRTSHQTSSDFQT